MFAGDGGHFARHAVVAPEVGAVRDALVIDLDDAVRQRDFLRPPQFDDAGVIAIDFEFGSAGQHAVALDSGNDLQAKRNVDCTNARTAVRRAADHRLAAIPAGIDNRLHVVAVFDRFNALDCRRHSVGEQCAHCFDAFAFGCLHGDQALERFGGNVEAVDKPANPVIRELHSKLPQETQIAALQPADIVDRVAHHYESGQTKPEGKAVPLRRIDAALAQHMRIHQAAGQQFDPAALLAHRAAVARRRSGSGCRARSRVRRKEKIQGAAVPSHRA